MCREETKIGLLYPLFLALLVQAKRRKGREGGKEGRKEGRKKKKKKKKKREGRLKFQDIKVRKDPNFSCKSIFGWFELGFEGDFDLVWFWIEIIR